MITGEAEREERFQRYIELSQPYMDKIAEAGDEPWHKGDIAARRARFMRRYKSHTPERNTQA